MGVSLYKNLEDVDLKALISRKYRVPVFVENVVRLSALAEKHYGIAKANKDIVFVEISNGVGAGILIDGHLFRGSIGSAGEIGYSLIGTDSLEYKASNRGYLEKIASVEGMREAAFQALKEGQSSVIRDLVNGNLGEISSSIVCTAAARGDELANRIVRSVVDHFGVVFANMILILNPELLVVGGEISTLPQVMPLIIEPISLTIQKVIPFKAPPIRLSSLGDDAGVIGASHLAIESLLMRDFPYTMADLSEAL
jgi:glucokinase